MWIFTSDSFVSIVEHKADPGVLVVRGRFAGDAARFLGLPPEAEEVTPAADYRFRCYAARQEVMERAAIAVRSIGYPNFKKTVKQPWRERVAMAVWSILFREQNARAPRPGQRALFSSQDPLELERRDDPTGGDPAVIGDWLPRRMRAPLRSASSLLAFDEADRNHLAYGEPPF